MALVRCFRLVDLLQRRNKVVLAGRITPSARHVVAALALAGQHVAIVIQRATGVAVAERTTVLAFRQSVGLRKALVAVFAGDQAFARALAGVHVAARVVMCAENIARARFASFWIVGVQIPESVFARVTFASLDVRFAMAGARFDSVVLVDD